MLKSLMTATMAVIITTIIGLALRYNTDISNIHFKAIMIWIFASTYFLIMLLNIFLGDKK